MKYYIQSVNEAGEIVGVPEELLICKDCKWYEVERPHFCGIGKGLMFEEDFCSDGDWREDHDPR